MKQLFLIAVFIYPLLVNAQFSSSNVINTDVIDFPSALFTGDLDGDGFKDVIVSGYFDNNLYWYKNNGDGTFVSTQTIIGGGLPDIQSIYAGDIDGDNDIDVFYACAGIEEFGWFENLGSGNFSTKKLLINTVGYTNHITGIDLDKDGLIDLLSCSNDYVAWYKNTGVGSFNPILLSSLIEAPRKAIAHDFDSDNDLDLVVMTNKFDSSKIVLLENNGSTIFSIHSTIYSSNGADMYDMQLSDLDGDGLLDIIYANHDEDKIAWKKNTGGFLFSPTESVITTQADGITGIFVSDFNLDGIQDIASTSEFDGKVAVYYSISPGIFGTQTVLGTNDNPWKIHGDDFDNDADIDITSISLFDNIVDWYENLHSIPVHSKDYSLENTPYIFPIPFNNTINIMMDENMLAQETTFQLKNVLGKIYLSEKILNLNNQSISIENLDNIPAGIYFIEFLNNKTNSIIFQQKVVKVND